MKLRIEDLPENLRPTPEMPREAVESMVRVLEVWMARNHPGIRVYDISGAAELLGVKERAVKHHLHTAKDLKYLTIGREIRIREEDIKEFLENRLRPTIHDSDILSKSRKGVPNGKTK